METLDSAWVKAQLSSPPFAVIEGVVNVRSLGNYPSETLLGCHTKSNFMFRSGEISGITQAGKEQLKELGIKKIFDLRSNIEFQKFGSTSPDLGPDVKIQRLPVFKDEAYSPELLTLRSKLYAAGTIESMMELYSQILDDSAEAASVVFTHIRDNPNEGFLFHCSAGKDRTGVLAALLLKMAGVADGNIAKDYYLTRVGRDPDWDATVAKFLSFPDFAGDKQAVLNTLSTRHETMISFLQLLEEKHGGMRNYLESRLGFSSEDVEIIQRNLVQEADDSSPRAVSSTPGEVVVQ